MSNLAEELIPENIALELVGVSGNTLQRFREAGYLKSESNDGSIFYYRSELQNIFGIKDFTLYEFKAKNSTHSNLSETKEDSDTTETQTCETITENNSTIVALEIEAEAVEDSTTDNILDPNASHKMVQMESEIFRLKSILNLQEKIAEMKDQELLELKKQRDWLQTRVERMEEKANRDQLILLSETQMLSHMLVMRSNKGIVQRALCWLGFTDEPNNSNTVEIDSNLKK